MGHAAHRYASGNNKYMKEYEKAKNHHILCICMQITYIKYRAHNNFKTSIKLWINTKKVNKGVQFSQKVQFKSYIDINGKLITEAYVTLERIKQVNNAGFGKTMENVRKHRDFKLLKTNQRRNCLVSELNYRKAKCFSENLIVIEMEKK